MMSKNIGTKHKNKYKTWGSHDSRARIEQNTVNVRNFPNLIRTLGHLGHTFPFPLDNHIWQYIVIH